ncbi:hypothetical protein [Facilibium subflavum]|uniref:hypothetical protein n=1 Tax=Facilibium subflavum TaxID=2219058 RepID=UPI000E65CCB4|nr:hypothetical protein [Facilibium subflavum]
MSQLLPHEAEYFFKLHRSLMHFTNQKYNISAKFKKVEDFQSLDNDALQNVIPAIREKMYDTAHIKQFCDENPYDLTEKDLAVVHQWKGKLITSGFLVRHLRDYSVVMAPPSPKQDNRLYGIKGITHSLADYLPSDCLPYQTYFILLPFLGHIVYDGFFSANSIYFGSNIKRSIKDEYNHIKALDGIYAKHTIGDDLSNPPQTASVKDVVTYSIKNALDEGEFPHKALEYAKKHNERAVFEKAYTAKFIKNDKKHLNDNDELPKMHYGAYRETIIAVQPTKKDLLAFCKKHYPKLVDYITVFSV